MYLICVFISGFNNKAECCLISFANAIFIFSDHIWPCCKVFYAHFQMSVIF